MYRLYLTLWFEFESLRIFASYVVAQILLRVRGARQRYGGS